MCCASWSWLGLYTAVIVCGLVPATGLLVCWSWCGLMAQLLWLCVAALYGLVCSVSWSGLLVPLVTLYNQFGLLRSTWMLVVVVVCCNTGWFFLMDDCFLVEEPCCCLLTWVHLWPVLQSYFLKLAARTPASLCRSWCDS